MLKKVEISLTSHRDSRFERVSYFSNFKITSLYSIQCIRPFNCEKNVS